MNLNLSEGDRAFRDEVRAFLAEHLQDDWREGQRRTTAMYPEPEVSGPWQRVLNDKGWLVPLWPREWGGTGWTALQRFIFETECALAGAPLVHPMGVRLVGPLLLHYGTEAQKREHLPRILSGQDYWARASPSLAPAPTWPPCNCAPGARVSTTCSTAPRSGPPTPTTPTACLPWCAPATKASASRASAFC